MVDFQKIKDAKLKIDKYVEKTPIIHSTFLSNLCKGQVYFKLENEQITNSFKIRGAFNKILNLTPFERKRGVITASSGNHAQAVGIVAEKLDIIAKIVVPKSTPKNKLDKIRKYEVILQLHGENYDEAEMYARNLAKEENMTFVSAYNDELVVAGQGTIGLEISKQLTKFTDILVPLGGGGLISGIAIAIKELHPEVRIIGVQTEASPSFYESLKAGKIVEVEFKETIADGVFGGIEKGSITFDIVKELVDEVIVVKEETIRKAISLIWHKENMKVEGSAAMAIAPILEDKNKFENKIIICVISGGNIDSELFQTIIEDQNY
ncbi:MAG: pyridoxal-phosphate dependent enzyme [Asgard group archaeon]|nr:pyridoxal-phosphate dependent enzyme [Asgard group archaeon]